MLFQKRNRIILLVFSACLMLSSALPEPSRSQEENQLSGLPEWVPEKYRRLFFRSVRARPGWEVALGHLGIDIRNEQPAFALVAGISKYPKLGSDGDLWPAQVDVQKMIAYLSRQPDAFNDIVVLIDEDMTEDNLRYFLTSYFPRRFGEMPNSRFLFTYSGHGVTTNRGHGYLLTSQAVDFIPQHNFDNRISFATLRAYFQEIVNDGYQVLALINACFGAEFHQWSFGFGDSDLPPGPTKPGAHAITAGASDELTWSDQNFGISEGRKGSVFFEAVFAALDGVADSLPRDGIVDVRELDTYLHGTISRFSDERQNPIGGDLIPTRSKGGFFFLSNDWQLEHDNASPLNRDWWSWVSFGPVDDSTRLSAVPAMPTRPADFSVCLITQTETDPFSVKIREGAQAKADELSIELTAFAGLDYGDNEAQVAAMEACIANGVSGILLVPSDGAAIAGTVRTARDNGILVFALDRPLEPIDAADITFATDNFTAGERIGAWVKAQLGPRAASAKIAYLDLSPAQPTVDVLRDQGFMQGFGIDLADPTVIGDETDPRNVCHEATGGSPEGGRAAMETCLEKDSNINVVYTINELAAAGAYEALKAVGREEDVLLVSIDGSCPGIEDVVSGMIDATSQQYPVLMASMGIEAVDKFKYTGEKPRNPDGMNFIDTGTMLVTDEPADGVESIDSTTALELCWGWR